MPLEKALTQEEGWKDIPAPELIKWDKPGQQIAGVLLSVGRVKIENKSVEQFTFTLGEKTFKCLATYDLRQKITAAHVGCQFRIKYLGEDENIKGGPNNQPMKMFSVHFKGTPSAPVTGGPITDDDIPF